MSDLNDLSKPITTDTEPNVLDTLRAHIVRAATWSGWGSTANKVAGIMSSVTAPMTGGRSLRLYRRNDANTADEEVVFLPGMSVGGNAATASAAQAGSTLETTLAAKAPLNSPNMTGTPTVPTASVGNNSTQAANTAFVATALANLVGSVPAALDTLAELASALGGDANFASTVNSSLANRVVKTSSNRPGVFKLYRNDDDSNYSVQITWQADKAGHWSLRGYSGDNYHAPCYVASAKYADSAGSANAADVHGWAKQPTKPSYSKDEVGLGRVDNTPDVQKSVDYANKAGSAAGVPWAGLSGRPELPALVSSYNTGYLGDGANGTKTFDIPLSAVIFYGVPIIKVDFDYWVFYNSSYECKFYLSSARIVWSGGQSFLRIVMFIEGVGQVWPYNFKFSFYA